jgi:Ca2+-binding EF-hand superfamily protein
VKSVQPGATIRLPSDLERQLKKKLRERNILLRDIFIDFDNLRSGVVSADIFKRVVSNVGVIMNAVEFEQLCSLYSRGDAKNQIDYVAFCTEMESGEAVDTRLAMTPPPRLRLPSRHRPKCHRPNEARAHKARRLRTPPPPVADCQGMQGLVSALQAHDPGNNSLDATSFRAALSQAGLLVSSDEVEALVEAFVADVHGRIAYGDFLRIVRGGIVPSEGVNGFALLTPSSEALHFNQDFQRPGLQRRRGNPCDGFESGFSSCSAPIGARRATAAGGGCGGDGGGV